MEFSDEDKEFIESKVRPAYEKMETHCEIFDLPSGSELWLYCDGRYKIISKEQP